MNPTAQMMTNDENDDIRSFLSAYTMKCEMHVRPVLGFHIIQH